MFSPSSPYAIFWNLLRVAQGAPLALHRTAWRKEDLKVLLTHFSKLQKRMFSGTFNTPSFLGTVCRRIHHSFSICGFGQANDLFNEPGKRKMGLPRTIQGPLYKASLLCTQKTYKTISRNIGLTADHIYHHSSYFTTRSTSFSEPPP